MALAISSDQRLSAFISGKNLFPISAMPETRSRQPWLPIRSCWSSRQLSSCMLASQLSELHMEINLEVFDQSDCTLAPGEPVSESGVYEICHVDEPRRTALLLRNTIFPFCRRCGDSVRYRLVQSAPHISEDSDFVEGFKEDNPIVMSGVLDSSFPLQLGRPHGFRFWQQIVQAWRSSAEGGNL